MREAITQFCRTAGSDPLLVQGAGGNVSWKDKDTLWIKASGTWLAEASNKEIFVPVDLRHLRLALAENDFAVQPIVRIPSVLAPSIETLLHALLPHPVVVHLHPVEILAYLVREDAEAILGNALGQFLRWVTVPYRKPGAELAQVVADVLVQNPNVDVVFLRNHGVVIGGGDVGDIERCLRCLLSALTNEPSASAKPNATAMPLPPLDSTVQYFPVADLGIQQLALDESLFSQLRTKWVLYPDHAVFLGPRAFCYDSTENLAADMSNKKSTPELVFVRGTGVYARESFGLAKEVQLRCYYDVLVRQHEYNKIRTLHDTEIAELLDWDAEKYRMQLAK